MRFSALVGFVMGLVALCWIWPLGVNIIVGIFAVAFLLGFAWQITE